MKILNFKKFESEKYENNSLSEKDIEDILSFFLDIKDEGFYFIDKKDVPIGYLLDSLELTYQIRIDHLDDEGNDYYNSKKGKDTFVGFGLSTSEHKQKVSHMFSTYEQLIVNINIDSNKEKITNICKEIYSQLIANEYNCQVWNPTFGTIRFHISTQNSNPFLENKIII